jgi:hypothetical protein
MQAAAKRDVEPGTRKAISTNFPLARTGAAVYDVCLGEEWPRQPGLCHEISMENPNFVEDHVADRELIGRVAARDRQAFETLYLRYAPRVFRYLWSQIRQREVVEEALDDVMMVVWETAARFNGTSQLSTWSSRDCSL